MKILHVVASVSPEQGGPVEALFASEPAWRAQGHRREIVSLDLPDDPWVLACPLPVHALGSARTRRWTARFPLLRYGFAPRLAPWLKAHVAGFDAVIVNGLWNYATFACRRILPRLPTRYFVFTHGMLDPWFRSAFPCKHAFKQLAWWMCEGPLLHRATAVLFTNEHERRTAQDAFWPYRFPAVVAGYGTADPPPASRAQVVAFHAAVPTLRNRYLLFLGRLHAKKGCDLLVEAFARQAAQDEDLDLVMAGPDTHGLRPLLERRAEILGIAGRLHWLGHLGGDAKWGALRGCDAFVLPSHGENFGVAVVEALACGRPALISDKVGVAGDVEAWGAGLVAGDTAEGTAAMMARFLALPPASKRLMGCAARRCFEDRFDVQRQIAASVAILAGQAGP